MKINLLDADPTGLLQDLSELQDAATSLPSPVGAKGIIGAAARKACDGYAKSPLSNVPLAANAVMDGLCKPYYDSIGATGPSLGPPPFTGGQCANVGYNVSFRVDWAFGPSQGTQLVTGPVTGFVVRQGPPFGNGNIPWNAYILFGQGQEIQVTGGTDTPSGTQTGSITGVVRADNQPDTCGDPPKVFVPGNGPSYNYGDTFVHNAGGTVNNVNISVGAPSVDIDGNLNIPVTTDIGLGFSLGGSSPEVAPVANDPLQAQPAIPGDQLEANNGEFPEAPEGQEYVGALFYLTSFPEGEGFLAGSIPERVFPRTVGNARLKIRSANGVDSLTTNHQWREEGFSLYRPDPGLTVTGVRANVIPDFYYEVIPLTVKKSGE